MKKNYLLGISLLLSNLVFSQSWQWIERCGSLQVTLQSQDEVSLDLCSDRSGNIYLTQSLYPSMDANVGGEPISGFASNSINFALVSYDCNGDYRWSKLIGASAGSTGGNIGADLNGNIYGLARIYSQSWSPGQFQDDHFLPPSEKNFYIYKYDSLGVFQWAHSPLPDTISFFYAASQSYPVDIHVKDSGEHIVFCLLPNGANENGSIVLEQSTFMAVTYDADGNYLSSVELPIQIQNISSYDFSTWFNVLSDGSFIMSGYSFYPNLDELTIDGELIPRSYVVRFNTNGNVMWKREFQTYDPLYSNAMFLGRPAVDEDDNIYLTGGASHLDTLGGYVFVNDSQQNITSMPILVKFDANGNLLWAQHADVDAATISFAAATSGNTITTVGKYPGLLRWQGANDQLQHITNQGYDCFLALFNKETGDYLMQDSLTGTSAAYEEMYHVAAMPGGNYCFAGYFRDNLITPTDTIQVEGSGDTFFGKFGSEDCPVELNSSIGYSGSVTEYSVYPNPASDMVILPREWINADVVIVDAGGRLVKTMKSNSSTLSVRDLPNGLYDLRFSINNKYGHCRVLIYR